MGAPIFEQVTSALTVKSICSPMGPDIPSETSLDDLEGTSCHGLDPFNNPARIVDSPEAIRSVSLGLTTIILRPVMKAAHAS
jgi:hypothetical protein